MDPTRRVLVSLAGPDAPGVTASLTSTLADGGVRLLDVEQATLREVLALSFLLEMPGGASGETLLAGFLARARELGLDASVRTLDGGESDWAPPVLAYAITVAAPALRAMHLARIATIVASRGANIRTIRRLAGDGSSALELLVDLGPSGDAEALRAEVLHAGTEMEIDVGVEREDIFRKSRRLVVFDVDGTLLAGELLDELGKARGIGDAMTPITRAAMAGQIPFAEALRERVRLLRGTPVSLVGEVAAAIPLTPGARELLAALRNLGYRLAAVSGGFETVVGPLARDLDLDSFHANRLEIRDGLLTGAIEGEILDGPGKARVLREICARERISTDQAVAVGDGANDIELLAAAGLGIAFRGVERLRHSARGSIRRNDLGGILFFLGVSERDLQDLRVEGRRP